MNGRFPFVAELSNGLYWVAAAIFAATPIALATDFGGILPWPMHVSALALCGAGAAACLARLLESATPTASRLPPQAFFVTFLLLALLLGTCLQTIALPRGVVAWLSPASHDAHIQMAESLLGETTGRWITISISPVDSGHPIAYLTVATLVAFFSVFVFQDRGRITWMLTAFAIGGASIAAIGLARKTVPGFSLWSFQEGGEGAPFGTFLNRNNAALGINLGIASALGLVVWRKMALEPAARRWGRNRRPTSDWRDRFDWATDPPVAVALITLVLCLLGLVICGSRGGLASAFIASAVSLYLIRDQIGRFGGLLFVVTVVALLLFLVLRVDSLGNRALDDNTLTQIESSFGDDGGRSLSRDTRLAHWPDGFRTAIKHFPAGSGLATYGYAYLPWQQTSPWRWCVHADNLWLEMLVELGIIGMLFVAVLAWWTIRAIRRLMRSTDPIDRGLATTGCYAAVAIAISQFFDFGLIVPANLMVVAVLLPVILSRTPLAAVPAASDDPNRPTLLLLRDDTVWWKSPRFLREQLPQALCCAALLGIALPAVERLRKDSQSDHLVRTADLVLAEFATDRRRVEHLVEQADVLADNHPDPELLNALAKLQFQLGRLDELDRMNVERMPLAQRQALYIAMSRSNRRLGWRATQAELSEHVTLNGRTAPQIPVADAVRAPESPYSLALDRSEQSLRNCPLFLDARTNQIYLEFIHQQPERTAVALEQSAELFRNTPELQLRFGATAANHGAYDAATRCWKRAIELDAKMARRVLSRANRYPDFPVAALVPDATTARGRSIESLESLPPDLNIESTL